MSTYDPNRFAPRDIPVPPDFTHDGWDYLFEFEEGFLWVSKPAGAPNGEYDLRDLELGADLRLLDRLPDDLRDQAIGIMRSRITNWFRDRAVEFWRQAEHIETAPLADLHALVQDDPEVYYILDLEYTLDQLRAYVAGMDMDTRPRP